MLFRADFVRQKHVPGSIETNHGSLSKIIGNCWRQLPLEEKRIWEIKAKQEKANHKAQFPDYRFRPVHNKNKNKDKFASAPATTTTPATATTTNSSSLIANADNLTQEEEERRCEQVAQLLLEGMKGEELARAVRNLDRVREEETSNSRTQHPSSTSNLAMPIPMSSFHNPFGMGGFGYGMTSNSGMDLPPSAYIRRPSSVPLPPHNNSSDFFPFDEYSQQPAQALDMSAITLPSVPFITRPSSPINNISRHQHQQRPILGQRRASSAQPVFRRSWTLPINPSATTPFSNTDFSGFDWTAMPKPQVQRDDSPLPDVDPGLFNGFSFDEGGVTHTHCAVDTSSSSLFSLSSSVTSSASSAASDRNSPPWLETTAPNAHSRSHSQHMAIAPHDLPPLHVSDMNWHGGATAVATTQSLLSATSSSSSSTFPSPSPSSTPASTGNAKLDVGATPTNEMFGLSLGFEMGMDMNGGGTGGVGVDYSYAGYNDMGYGVGDLGMEMGYVMSAPQGNEMGMWNVVGQAQQA